MALSTLLQTVTSSLPASAQLTLTSIRPAGVTSFTPLVPSQVIDHSGLIADAFAQVLSAFSPLGLLAGRFGSIAVSPGSKVTFSPILPTTLSAVYTGSVSGVPNLSVPLPISFLVEFSLEAGDTITFDYSNPTQGLNVLYNGTNYVPPAFAVGYSLWSGSAATLPPPPTGVVNGAVTYGTPTYTFSITSFKPSTPTSGPTGRLAGGAFRFFQAQGLSLTAPSFNGIGSNTLHTTLPDENSISPPLTSALWVQVIPTLMFAPNSKAGAYTMGVTLTPSTGTSVSIPSLPFPVVDIGVLQVYAAGANPVVPVGWDFQMDTATPSGSVAASPPGTFVNVPPGSGNIDLAWSLS